MWLEQSCHLARLFSSPYFSSTFLKRLLSFPHGLYSSAETPVVPSLCGVAVTDCQREAPRCGWPGQVGTLFQQARRSGLWPDTHAVHRSVVTKARAHVSWTAFEQVRGGRLAIHVLFGLHASDIGGFFVHTHGDQAYRHLLGRPRSHDSIH